MGSKHADVAGGSDSRTFVRREFEPRWPLINSQSPLLRLIAYLKVLEGGEKASGGKGAGGYFCLNL